MAVWLITLPAWTAATSSPLAPDAAPDGPGRSLGAQYSLKRTHSRSMVQLLLYREGGLQSPQHSPHHVLPSIPPNITCIRAHPGTGGSVASSPHPVDMQQREFGLCQVFWFGHPFPWDGHSLISDYFSQRVCDRLQVSSARTGRLSSLAVRLQLPKSKLGDMNMQINASKLIAALLPPRGSKLG